MRIGIVSDTHSRYHTVAAALDLLRERNVDYVLHCVDIADAATIRMFEGFATHFVFGNRDTNRDELRAAMRETGAVLHEHGGNLELEGRKIAWVHGDDHRRFRDLENSGQFDYLFYGHTHQAE